MTTLGDTTLYQDPLWPRAGGWGSTDLTDRFDVAVVGIPTYSRSLSRTNAHQTPRAIRSALLRYSDHSVPPGRPQARGSERDVVLHESLRIHDFGDLREPDSVAGERAARDRIAVVAARARLTILLGGDNSCTVPGALGVLGDQLGRAGLITLDAHHDLRDGTSNGSPVRQLIEAGLDPRRIVQIGIADFANSRPYRQRARELGITVIHRDEMSQRRMSDVVREATSVAGAAGGPIYVDVDLDVCDRAVAPACPASLPGGISAWELRRCVHLLLRHPRVVGMDIAEVDATADSSDERTVRLAALTVLEAAAGLAQRQLSMLSTS